MNLARMMVVVVFGSAMGCSIVLDKDKLQCVVDSDCSKFDGHPTCNASGVCVASGLGPEGCFFGKPTTHSEYLNACSTSKCEPFNNCERLGICSPGMALPSTLDPMTSTSSSLVTSVEAPTKLCTDGAPGTPSSPNVVYLFGSADFGPLLRAAQPSLSALPTPYRAVFQGSSSCNGVNVVFDSDPTKRLMKDPPTEDKGGWAFYFDENRNQVNCRLDPIGASVGRPVDIGISNLYSQVCNPALVPGSAVAEYFGPVVSFVLSVPAASSQKAISAEAAHFVFGLGGKAPSGSGMKDALPWTDWSTYYIRNSGSGSTVLTALLVDVPKTKFWGVDRLSTENLRDGLLTSKSADSSIGILSIDFNDKNRGNLRALYLQAKGQNCGYLPDSSSTTTDKANVRDGHYPLWGYVHLFTRLAAGGEPSAAAKAMVLLFNLPKLEQRLLDDMIEASLVPQCAMNVTRASEIGDFSARTGLQCGCYFDFKTKGSNGCQQCTRPEECPSGRSACNYGYCEEQ